jgi:hypothetical protein
MPAMPIAKAKCAWVRTVAALQPLERDVVAARVRIAKALEAV